MRPLLSLSLIMPLLFGGAALAQTAGQTIDFSVKLKSFGDGYLAAGKPPADDPNCETDKCAALTLGDAAVWALLQPQPGDAPEASPQGQPRQGMTPQQVSQGMAREALAVRIKGDPHVVLSDKERVALASRVKQAWMGQQAGGVVALRAITLLDPSDQDLKATIGQ